MPRMLYWRRVRPLVRCLSLLTLAAVAFAQVSAEERLEQARQLEAAGSGAEARRVYEALLPDVAPQPAKHAEVLKVLGQLAGRLGDYKSAVNYASRSAEEYHQLQDRVGEASAWNNLGVSHLYEGDYPAAGVALQKAVALSAQAGDHDGQAEHLSNLANVFYFQARYLEALEGYERALALARQAQAEPWAPRRRAVVLINMATLRQRLGQDEAAMELYHQAGETPGVLRANEEAQLLTNRGVLYRRLGDPLKALDTYEEARRLFSRDHHLDGELTVLMNRGIVLALDLSDFEAAYRTFAGARALAHKAGSRREEMQARLYGAESLYREGRYAEARTEFTGALQAATALGTSEEEWKALYGLGRVALRAGDDSGASELLERAVTKIESVREKLRLVGLKSDFFADKRDVYDALIALGLKHPDPAAIFRWMERSRARALQDRLRVAGSPDLSAVQTALDDSTALIEFWLSRRGAAVLCITRATTTLAPVSVDETRVRVLAEALAGEGDWRPAAEALAASALRPGLIPRDVRKLVIVTDGALASVPLEVLPVDGRLLVERFAISYLASATLLMRKPEPAGQLPRWPWNTEFAGFADPVFASEGAVATGAAHGRLPQSAGEVRTAASLLRGGERLFLGAENRRENLVELLNAPVPVLHIATHATADPENPERSRILFSPSQAGSGTADYLFLKGVYDLNLSGIDLVTLSACDTETGKLVRGEGIQGFSRAFLAGGARSVVAALWRVADSPTAELMREFYQGLASGESKAESLRRAKLSLLRGDPRFSHPHYWAAFLLTGDGFAPLPQPLSWWAIVLPALLVTTVALLVFFRRQKNSCTSGPT